MQDNIKLYFRGERRPEIFPIRGTSGETLKQVGNIVDTGNWGNPQRGRVYSPDGVSPSLNGLGGGGGLEPKVIVRPCLTPDRPEKRQNGRRIKEHNEPMFTLTAQDRHGVAIKPKHIPGPNEVNNTLRASGHQTPTPKHNFDTIHDGVRIRRLTPKECFRLQGFPDEYFERARAANSDSQLYKQAGNTVSVPVIYEIARRLK